MTADDVLAELSRLGVGVWVEGENLRFRPADRVGQELLGWMRHHKPAVRELLASRVLVNHGAGGLGDALQGLLAVGGLAGKRVTYAVHPDAIPFVALFDGGYAELTPHVHDGNRDEPPTNTPLQLNVGYNEECQTRAARPRWRRYCDNIGVREPVLPRLRDPERLAKLGKPYAGCIVLAPFSTWSNREYHLQGWRTIAHDLKAAGMRPVVVDRSAERAAAVGCEFLAGAPADVVAGAIFAADCLVGGDSGLAHLSAIMGKDTVVLLGQTTYEGIFACYPRVHPLRGRLACDGCWWQAPYDGRVCDPCCASLQTVLPSDVVAAVRRDRRLTSLPLTKPLATFTDELADRVRAHLDEDTYLYRPGRTRYICSLFGALHQELADRPDLQRLVLEATWIARKLHDQGKRQEDLDWSDASTV